MASPNRPALDASRRRRPRLSGATLLWALAAQGVLILATVFIVVLTPPSEPEPEFTARPGLQQPQRQLEHRTALAAFQQAATRPDRLERLTVDALLPDAPPPLPSLPRSEFNPLESADFLARDAEALVARSGLADAIGQMDSAASAAAFFGIEDSGDCIVIIVNTSASVMRKARNRGVTIERIQEEVLTLLGSLDPRTQFAIVQFSQGVRTFADHPSPARAAAIEAAGEWIRTNLRGNPPVRGDPAHLGHEAGFEAAFAYDPDVVFLLTDGVLNRRTGSPGNYSYPEIPYSTFRSTLVRWQRERVRPARIHVIGFEMRADDAANMRRLTREFGGQVREF
ncbi:MAG: VWA domain-containing protein [Puniceicoccaceae bacterium]|nr:MAG: VWA domain-containing protein [Puniceicoccaceae bacterium]